MSTLSNKIKRSNKNSKHFNKSKKNGLKTKKMSGGGNGRSHSGSRSSRLFSSFGKLFKHKHYVVNKQTTPNEIVKSGIPLEPKFVTYKEETISYANLLKSGPGKINTLEEAEDFLRRYYERN
jgi:hypothetical protein